MAKVLQWIPGVVFFIDDTLVTGQTRGEHEATLQKVLDRIRKYGFCLNRCCFQEELEFLGHRISKDGVKPTRSHIISIKTLQPLRTSTSYCPFWE